MDVSCGGIDDTLRVLTRVGALGMILRDHPDLLPLALRRLRAALAERETNGKIYFNAATWIVTAAAA